MPDTALSVADVSALARERDRRQFADYVALHAANRKFIPRDEETTLLKAAIADFGMDRDQAQGVLMGIASEREICLESQAEENVRAFLEHKARKLKVARKDFKEAAAMYRRLVSDGLTNKEAKQRVKAIMIREGMKPRRIRLLFVPLLIPGARRWYNRIRV
jgi:hypothetical protein